VFSLIFIDALISTFCSLISASVAAVSVLTDVNESNQYPF
jgi:hypothetical protein